MNADQAAQFGLGEKGGTVTEPYFQQDNVTIYHGDCFDILPDLKGVGAVVTDPPYSSGGAFRGDRMQGTVAKYVDSSTLTYRPEFAGDNRDQRSFMTWASLWLNAARRGCVDGAPAVVFTDWRQLPTLSDALQVGGWVWRNMATWWKTAGRMQKGRFSLNAEYLLYATNGAAVEGKTSVCNVFKCAPATDRVHIAEKPLEVMKWALGVVPPDAVVLDPFMGSGTTLEAARALGHPAIGIDCDERYCEAAAARLAQKEMAL